MHALSEFNYFERILETIIKVSTPIPEDDIRNYVKECFNDVRIFIERTFIPNVCDVNRLPYCLDFKPNNTIGWETIERMELFGRLNVHIATEIRRCTGLNVYYIGNTFRFMNCTPNYY